MDIVKDDELLGNPHFNPLAARVAAYRRAADQVLAATGHRAIYCANITDSPERMIENGHRAQELGAGIVMVNAVNTGLGIVQALAEDKNFALPILTHYAGFGTLTESPCSGISSPLLRTQGMAAGQAPPAQSRRRRTTRQRLKPAVRHAVGM